VALDDTILALQDIARGIGLNAPESYPAALAPSMFPIALTFIGQMDAAKFGTTTYVTLVMIAPAVAGINPDQVFQSGNAFLKLMREAFRPLGAVNGFAIAKGGNPTAHGGFGSPAGMLSMVKYGGSELYGYEFHVPLIGAS